VFYPLSQKKKYSLSFWCNTHHKLTSNGTNMHRGPSSTNDFILLCKGWTLIGLGWNLDQTKLFVKFKITKLNCLHFELNRTVSDKTELFWTERNSYYWYSWKKKQTKSNFSYRIEFNCSEFNRIVLNRTLFRTELNCFSSISELFLIV